MNRWRAAFFALLLAVVIAGAGMLMTKPAHTEPAVLNVRIMHKCFAVPQRTWRTDYQFTEAVSDALY